MTTPQFQPIGSISFDDLDNQPDPTWLVNEILVDGGIGVLSGDGGHGKTWLSLLLAISVASGRKWLNHFSVRRGPVVIIDEENSLPLLKQRKRLLMAGLGLNNSELLPIRIISHKGIDFFPQKQRNGSITQRNIFYSYVLEIQQWQPALIIVDSLRASHSGQEDKSDDIRPVMNAIRQMAAMAGNNTGVMIPHHVNKNGNFRGSIDIKQAANTLIEVDKRKDSISLSCSKMRDGIEFEPFKVKMSGDDNAVWLAYDGKKKQAIELSTWLHTVLSNGVMSRENLIMMAEKDDICKSRKLDDELKWREADGCITSFMNGKMKLYKLTSQYMPWPDFKKPNGAVQPNGVIY